MGENEPPSDELSDDNEVSILNPISTDLEKITSRILYMHEKCNPSSCNANVIESFDYPCTKIEINAKHKVIDLPDCIHSEIFDAVIIDCRKITKKITDFTCNLKQTVPYDLPIIFVTEEINIAARLAAVRAGGDGYETKPVNILSLIDTLDHHTRKKDTDPFRVLIIDDCSELTTTYSMYLQQAGINTRSINDPLMTLGAIHEFAPELILIDIYMPNCTGPELASIIRQHNTLDSVPIVFLSAESDINLQLEALRLGGDDFLTKPITSTHLVAAVKIRAERYRELRSYMVRDGMTGLYNRKKIDEQLDIELSRATRQKTNLCYAIIDIDLFKKINDNFGHGVGDQVIKQLARLLLQSFRKTDTVGRYGGEEFVVIFWDVDINIAVELLTKLRIAFHDIVYHSDQGDFRVSLSCGVSNYPHYENAKCLAEAADQALYKAKHAGRNQIIIAEPSKDAA